LWDMMQNPEESGRGRVDNGAHVQGLLRGLRQAVNGAILGSRDVNAALLALSQTGHCPSLSVDVSFGEQVCDERPVIEQCINPGGLALTAADQEFLQRLGITVETAREVASEAA
jgi:hypothetical protein